MSDAGQDTFETTVVMTPEAISRATHQIAQEIIEANQDMHHVVLLGILSRGRPLAERIARDIQEQTGVLPRVGSLATTLYRDDLRSGKAATQVSLRETHFDFDVDGVTVILVDDVISKGRTIRAALDEVMDYGRPARIQLACLIDRGHRELPIQPDYLGWSVSTEASDHISVMLREIDDEDVVLLERTRRSTTEEE